MDIIELGRIKAQRETPEPIKFAWPAVLLPELFATPRHLAILLGYLTTIGWEAYVPDLRAAIGDASRLAKFNFNDLIALASEAIEAIGREVVVIGHGVGGLAALKLGEHRRVKASVAFAPLIPGFRTPLAGGIANRIAMMIGRPINPPRGRVLFELIADAEPFAREGLIKKLHGFEIILFLATRVSLNITVVDALFCSEVKVISSQVRSGALADCILFPRRKLCLKLVGDFFGDFALDGKDIG